MVAERIPTEEDVEGLPFSCSTNLSNDVIEHWGMLGPGPLALAFLARMHRKTFGDAGDHRKNNESFLSCTFDLAGWATALGCNRSNLLRTRAHLEESHVIRFVPGEPGSGRGKLTWNIRFTEWTYYHRRVAKRQQASLVAFPGKTELILLDSTPPLDETELSTVGNNDITKLSLPDVAICNRTKDACSEGTAGEAPETPKKEYEEERDTKESTPDGVAPLSADASASVVSGSSSSRETPQQGNLFTGDTKQETSAKPAASSKKRPKKEVTPEEQELAERKAALAKTWLEHPNARVVKPQHPSGWSQFNKGINLLALAGVQTNHQGPLIDAMLTWSKGTYMPTPMKMYGSLDEVELTLMQLEAKKGATHAGRNSHQTSQRRDSEPGSTGQSDYIITEDEYGCVTILSAPIAHPGAGA